MEDKDAPIFFIVEIDKETLYVVLDTLSYMSEHYYMKGVIDSAAWIICKDEVVATFNLLNPYVNSTEDVVKISMALHEWHTYIRMVDYAGYCTPLQGDRITLEGLYETYSDLEDERELREEA